MLTLDKILRIAVSKWNAQYGEAVKLEDFRLEETVPNVNFVYAYQLRHLTRTDLLPIRLYLNPAPRDNLTPYRVEVREGHGDLKDEAYVAVGEIAASKDEILKPPYLKPVDPKPPVDNADDGGVPELRAWVQDPMIRNGSIAESLTVSGFSYPSDAEDPRGQRGTNYVMILSRTINDKNPAVKKVNFTTSTHVDSGSEMAIPSRCGYFELTAKVPGARLLVDFNEGISDYGIDMSKPRWEQREQLYQEFGIYVAHTSSYTVYSGMRGSDGLGNVDVEARYHFPREDAVGMEWLVANVDENADPNGAESDIPPNVGNWVPTEAQWNATDDVRFRRFTTTDDRFRLELISKGWGEYYIAARYVLKNGKRSKWSAAISYHDSMPISEAYSETVPVMFDCPYYENKLRIGPKLESATIHPLVHAVFSGLEDQRWSDPGFSWDNRPILRYQIDWNGPWQLDGKEISSTLLNGTPSKKFKIELPPNTQFVRLVHTTGISNVDAINFGDDNYREMGENDWSNGMDYNNNPVGVFAVPSRRRLQSLDAARRNSYWAGPFIKNLLKNNKRLNAPWDSVAPAFDIYADNVSIDVFDQPQWLPPGIDALRDCYEKFGLTADDMQKDLLAGHMFIAFSVFVPGEGSKAIAYPTSAFMAMYPGRVHSGKPHDFSVTISNYETPDQYGNLPQVTWVLEAYSLTETELVGFDWMVFNPRSLQHAIGNSLPSYNVENELPMHGMLMNVPVEVKIAISDAWEGASATSYDNDTRPVKSTTSFEKDGVNFHELPWLHDFAINEMYFEQGLTNGETALIIVFRMRFRDGSVRAWSKPILWRGPRFADHSQS